MSKLKLTVIGEEPEMNAFDQSIVGKPVRWDLDFRDPHKLREDCRKAMPILRDIIANCDAVIGLPNRNSKEERKALFFCMWQWRMFTGDRRKGRKRPRNPQSQQVDEEA